MYNNISFDDREASMLKEPNAFSDFTYDNEGNKLLDMIDQIKIMVRKVNDDIYSVNAAFDSLARTYGNETSYLDYIDDSKSFLLKSGDDLSDISGFALNTMKYNIEQIEDKDEQLINEIALMESKIKEGM